METMYIVMAIVFVVLIVLCLVIFIAVGGIGAFTYYKQQQKPEKTKTEPTTKETGETKVETKVVEPTQEETTKTEVTTKPPISTPPVEKEPVTVVAVSGMQVIPTITEEIIAKIPIDISDITMSSILGTFTEENLIDNNVMTFAHTSVGSADWIEVKLKKEMPIRKIIITNRQDCCQDRLKNTKVTIFNDSSVDVYNRMISETDLTSTTIEIIPTNVINGRIIKLEQPSNVINIGELEIYTTSEALTTYPVLDNWRCGITSVSSPMSKNANGDVQCMSTNGKDCIVKTPKEECRKLIKKPPSDIKPLVCGEAHKKYWGSTGYDSPTHWCSVAKSLIPDNPTGWNCGIGGKTMPLSKTMKGDIQCMSTDGKNCIVKPSVDMCNELIKNPPSDIKPLVCGDAHKAIYGTSGYDDSKHWCAIGRSIL